MTQFTDLPEDLMNLVCSFAYCCKYSQVYYSLTQYLKILCYSPPKPMMKRRLFSLVTSEHIPNPLLVFEPICNIGTYRDLFDWNFVYLEMWKLDFRRAAVRCYGSRAKWHVRFALDWNYLLEFCMFHRALLLLPASYNIFKPSLRNEFGFRSE